MGDGEMRVRRHRAGFTLLELLVVMAIMGMLMTVGVVAFFSIGKGARMRGAVSNVQSVLSLVRQRAILKQHPLEIRFDDTVTDAVSYRVWSPTENTWIGEEAWLPGGVSASFTGFETVSANVHGLTFTPAGNGGFTTATIVLNEIGGGPEQWTLTIYGLTGLVRVEDTTP